MVDRAAASPVSANSTRAQFLGLLDLHGVLVRSPSSIILKSRSAMCRFAVPLTSRLASLELLTDLIVVIAQVIVAPELPAPPLQALHPTAQRHRRLALYARDRPATTQCASGQWCRYKPRCAVAFRS
jgi:hypothetical protein